MKEYVIGGGLGLLVGVGGVLGVTLGIPSVQESFVKHNTNMSVNEISALVDNLKVAKNTILDKENFIKSVQAQLNNVVLEKNKIQAELEDLKNSNLDLIEMQEQIKLLENDLNSKEEQILIYQNQLNQLQIDKTALEERVLLLEQSLTEMQEKLDKYESTTKIDKFDINNFNGIWYKNGTFEDYFVIENGVITRGANLDKGVVQNVYNQMYLFMNNGSLSCELNDNGTNITLSDGVEYTKSFIYTTIPAPVNYIFITGKYSFGDNEIVLKDDNTIEMTILNSKMHGAYLVNSLEKNVGGNVTLIQQIKATIDGVEYNFELVNNSGHLVNRAINETYVKVLGNASILYSSATTTSFTKTNCYKFIVKTAKPITILSKKSEYVFISYSTNGSTSSNVFILNGMSCPSYSGYMPCFGFYNSSSEDITNNYFEFYLTATNSSFVFDNINSIGGSDATIISVEKVGNVSNNIKISDRLNSLLNGIFYKDCDIIDDFYLGNLSNENYLINVLDNQVSINFLDLENQNIIADSYQITAKTDGINIWHHFEIKYNLDGLKTLSFDLLNNEKILTNVKNV